MIDRRIAPEVVRYSSRQSNEPGLETVTLGEVRERGSARHLAAYQRLEFHFFLLYTAGRGFHTVDFDRLPVEPGTLVIVKAGSVHRFELNDSLDGRLLVARPEIVAAEQVIPRGQAAPWRWPSWVRLSPCAAEEFLHICDQVHADIGREAPQLSRSMLARLRLHTWLLLLQMACDEQFPPATDLGRAPDLVATFESLLDEHLKDRWTVGDYARKLGYSERTLTRACLSCRGLTAKCILDSKILLEIKRRLVQRNDGLAAIAYDLGFSEPSGMIQFFKRLEGVSPSAFRRASFERA